MTNYWLKGVVVITCTLALSACQDEAEKGKLFCGYIGSAAQITEAIGGWVDKSKPEYMATCEKLLIKSQKKVPRGNEALYGPNKGLACGDTEDDFGLNICTKTCMKKRSNKRYKVTLHDIEGGKDKLYCKSI